MTTTTHTETFGTTLLTNTGIITTGVGMEEHTTAPGAMIRCRLVTTMIFMTNSGDLTTMTITMLAVAVMELIIPAITTVAARTLQVVVVAAAVAVRGIIHLIVVATKIRTRHQLEVMVKAGATHPLLLDEEEEEETQVKGVLVEVEVVDVG